MAATSYFVLTTLLASVIAQRSPYARRPVGYPSLEDTGSSDLSTQTIGNRFNPSGNGGQATNCTSTTGVCGAQGFALQGSLPPRPALQPTTQPTTTMQLPLEALGDRPLVERLLKTPKDKQPFWLLNWQHLEQFRKQPQTYDSRPSFFIDRTAWMPRHK